MSCPRNRSRSGFSVTRRLELADQLGVTAELELGVDQLLAGSRAKLFEPSHLDVYEGLEREVGQRRPAPEAECLAQEL